MSVFVSILGLGFLILIHEAGHFFVARAVGMNPRKFYIGFPPAVAKAKRNGIEYGIGAIPLGGYVKIPGMHRPAAGDLDIHFGRAIEEQPSLRRPLDRLRERLDESDYTGARAAVPDVAQALQSAELSTAAAKAAERGLGDVEDALAPDAYWRAKTWKRVAVIFAGPGANLILAVVLFAALFMAGGGKATRTVDEVVADTHAAAMGLHAGDTIIAIEGKPVASDEIAGVISSSNGRPLTVTVDRNGRRVALGPTKPEETNGAYRLGFVLAGEGLGLIDSTWQAIRVTGIITKEIGASLSRLVTGSGRKEISSPVGIVQGSSQAVDQGYDNYLWVLGLISLSLALLNLLPLLPLDGGHIAFSLVEGVRGKAVTREVYERVSAVGIALVLLLFFIGLSNDIGRLGN
jgi:regulator of sigma E protease